MGGARLKDAEVTDAWRGARKRSYQTKEIIVESGDSPGLGRFRVAFTPGITAVCGGNGVGKTRLLNATYAILDAESATAAFGRARRFGNAELFASIRTQTGTFGRSVSFTHGVPSTIPEGFNAEVVHVDSSAAVARLNQFYGNEGRIEKIIEPLEERVLTIQELAQVAYVVGRDYSRAGFYESDVLDPSGDPYPVFTAQIGSAAYNSHDMGQGEIAAHYILWHLRRLNDNAILLLEEPETFLSAMSQERLVNVLAEQAKRRGIWSIITTHSEAILRRVDPKEVHLVARAGDLMIHRPTHELEYLSPLGIMPRIRALVLVEDSAAASLARAWVGFFSLPWLRESEIVVAEGGVPAMTEALRLPPYERGPTLVGVFDPDQRGKKELEEAAEEWNWPWVFLPGESYPEADMMRVCTEHRALFIDRVGRPQNIVLTALSTAEGPNPRTWFKTLQELLQMSSDELARAIVDVWFEDQDERSEAGKLFDDYVGAVKDGRREGD